MLPHDSAVLRDGRVAIEMYTIAGNEDIDYAKIVIEPLLANRSATERGITLRFGGTKPVDLIERTPVQRFTSDREFMDIPISGRARWLAVDPEGAFSEGLFDDREPESTTQPPVTGRGWTFVWVVEGSRSFAFGELCTPRFIDESETCPLGEAGIEELDVPADFDALPTEFQDMLALYLSGEHLRVRAA